MPATFSDNLYRKDTLQSALDAFKRALIFDSSSWDINPGLKHVLPGSSGGASDANCKLQAGYEYKSGSLGFFEVTEGIKPDQAYSNRLVDFVEKDDLILTNLVPISMGMSVFQELVAKGAYSLSKLLIGTTLRNADTLEKIDLGATLRSFNGNILEMNVIMGNDKHHVSCRLIGLRVTEQVANMWLAKKMKVSFDKLYKRTQERAFSLLQNILITVSTAVKQFLQEINRLAIACFKSRQPSRKTTLELLEDIHAFLLP